MTSCSFSCSKELETVVQVSSDGVFTLDSSVSTRTRLQPWKEKQYLKNKIKIWTSYNENKKLWNENYLNFFYVLEIQWTFPLPKLHISPCLSTPWDPSLSMSIYSQSFLSLHVYLLPEIPLYLCLFTPRASYLSMSIYSRRSLSIYVYSLPELPISPCLSTPGDPILSMSIYSQSFLSLHVYLLPEIPLYLCLSTLGAPSFSIYIFSQSFFSLHIYLLCAPYYYVTFPSSCVQHSPLDVTERICLGVADSWVTSPLPTIFTGVSCSIISPGRDKQF